MNYEDLYGQLQILNKNLKDCISSAQRLQKTISRDTETGDLKDIARNLSILKEAINTQSETASGLLNAVEGFDAEKYFTSGDFTEQLLSICRERNVDVHGDFPVFEMFPYRVRIDAENQDLYLDRKRISCMRPASFVDTIKKSQEKLNKAFFNADSFIADLAAAYDTAIVTMKKQPESDIYLDKLYKLMVPMTRLRKEYDKQNFAYDIARLNASDLETIKDGRRFQLGPARDNSKGIRILGKDGKEQYFATIRFFTSKGL